MQAPSLLSGQSRPLHLRMRLCNTIPVAANIWSPNGAGNVRLSQPSRFDGVLIKDEHGQSTPQVGVNQAETLKPGVGTSGQSFAQYGKSIPNGGLICSTGFCGHLIF